MILLKRFFTGLFFSITFFFIVGWTVQALCLDIAGCKSAVIAGAIVGFPLGSIIGLLLFNIAVKARKKWYAYPAGTAFAVAGTIIGSVGALEYIMKYNIVALSILFVGSISVLCAMAGLSVFRTVKK